MDKHNKLQKLQNYDDMDPPSSFPLESVDIAAEATARGMELKLDDVVFINDTLQSAAKCGRITSADISDAFMKIKAKDIIRKHEKDYKVRYIPSEDRWATYYRLPDGTVKEKRTRKKEDLVAFLAAYYSKDDTFGAIYARWIKTRTMASPMTAQKLQWVWKKYYEASPLENWNIKEVSIGQLRDFFISVCVQHSLTERQAKEAKSLLNMIYDYAVEYEIIDDNKARKLTSVTSGQPYLADDPIKSRNEEVFSKEEHDLVVSIIREMYAKTKNTIYIGIMLNFMLGLRCGELAPLQFGDFDFTRHTLQVVRQETSGTSVDEKGIVHRSGYNTVDHLKRYNRKRTITLTRDAETLVRFIHKANAEAGFPDCEWLFINENGERRHTRSVDKCLEKICAIAEQRMEGFVSKSNHKIRKTFLSNLFKSREFSLVEIRDMAGHKDGRMTLAVYGFDLEDDSEKEKKMNRVFGNGLIPFIPDVRAQ